MGVDTVTADCSWDLIIRLKELDYYTLSKDSSLRKTAAAFAILIFTSVYTSPPFAIMLPKYVNLSTSVFPVHIGWSSFFCLVFIIFDFSRLLCLPTISPWTANCVVISWHTFILFVLTRLNALQIRTAVMVFSRARYHPVNRGQAFWLTMSLGRSYSRYALQ